MKIRNLARAAALTMLAIAGLAAAGVWPKAADAWDYNNLPNGYSETRIHIAPAQDGTACIDLQISYGTAGTTDIGSTCEPGFQAALDAYVNATICAANPAAGQAQGMCLPPPTTTTAATTTAQTTTTAVTTTDPTVTAPAPVGGPAPAVTTSSVPPDPAPPTVTVTTTVTVPDPTLEQRIAALEKKYAELAARVDAIEQANTASWDAFNATLAAGGTVADAALAARSAGWNAIYMLT